MMTPKQLTGRSDLVREIKTNSPQHIHSTYALFTTAKAANPGSVCGLFLSRCKEGGIYQPDKLTRQITGRSGRCKSEGGFPRCL